MTNIDTNKKKKKNQHKLKFGVTKEYSDRFSTLKPLEKRAIFMTNAHIVKPTSLE